MKGDNKHDGGFSRRKFFKAVAGTVVGVGASAVATRLAGVGVVGMTTVGSALPAMAARPKYSTPTIACASATGNTIELQVCAGLTGAPAGFSVQWMTCDEYAANGNAWYLSDDPRLCKASFSGKANNTNWNLGAGACVDVVIGGLNDSDPGVSFTCNDPLKCETCYVFRAFVHADSNKTRSDFTPNLQCTTGNCPVTSLKDGDFCTKSQGYFGTPGTGQGGVTPPSNGSWQADADALAVLGGIALIGGGTYSASWSTVAAIVAYLPGGGPSSALSGTTTNAAPSGGGNLAAQTLALTLNLALSGSGSISGTCNTVGYPTGYGALKLCNFAEGDTFKNDGTPISAATATALNGQTISQVLAAANTYLGNGGTVPYGLTNASDLGELVANLNLAFDGKDWDGNGSDDCECGGMSSFAENHLCKA